MPELPEVETVRRGLAPALEHAIVVKADVRRPDLRFPFPDDLQGLLEGARITSLSRRAKYLLIELDRDQTLIAHLGMSGSYRVETLHEAVVPERNRARETKDTFSGHMLRSKEERSLSDGQASTPGIFHHERSDLGAHDHLVLDVDGGQIGPARIIYNDPRRFGFVLATPTATLHEHKMLRDLGPEPMGNSLTPEYLADRFAGRSQPMKAALLDQSHVAGLGNIYVCEALNRAKISPKRQAKTLVTKSGKPTDRLVALTKIIREVISEAIEAGGSSLRDHKQTDGSLGYFQHRFSAYDREHAGCANEGCRGTITRIVQSGRSTFYCPTCQR
ncbi:MAG: bifunctional DNA-formamidopyrimidine glycosylase/DNA-(apurinic or apyrimidinic site) lyase [Hyphomicrobiales bacterium]